jgi:pyruvate,water dikinase
MTDGGEPLLLPLAAVGGDQRQLAGGKACRLGELLAAGFDVPDGLVLTTEAHRLAADAVRRAGRDPADPLSWEFPEDLADALDDHRMRFGGTVAVRSSAADEDTPTSSAAGRYATVLDVRDRAGLVAAVQACWASAARAEADGVGRSG